MPRRAHRHFAALALALGASCVPPFVPRAPAPSTHAPPVARAAPPSTEGPDPRAALPRLEGAPPCPIAFDDADVVLARVGDVTITACDVATRAERAAREGRTPASPSALLGELVDDALLADEARARGLDHDPDAVHEATHALASALVRDEALSTAPDAVPTPDAVAAYYASHPDEFALPERAHLREVVLADEAQARAVLRDAATVPFDDLVRERTVTPEGRRDEGDLGLVPREGNDHVARAVADAGFAVTDPGALYPEPVRVEQTELVGQRHPRPHTVVRWHVVQRLDTVPASRVPLEQAARSIAHRLAYGRYEAARDAARQALLDRLERENPPAARDAELRRVRLRPPERAAPSPRGRHR